MSPKTHPGWESDLVELLDRQRQLYAQLHALSRQQEQMVAGAEPDLAGLSRLSGRRRNTLDQLARVTQRIEPYRRDWPHAWPSLSGESRARIAESLRGVQGWLDAILCDSPEGRGERCA